MASTSQAVAGASRAISQTTRRVSKRTLQSNRTAALSNLISLYHLTPTFVPTYDATRLQTHITETLAPVRSSSNKPRPHHLIDLVFAENDLDVERVKLDHDASTSSSTSSSTTAAVAGGATSSASLLGVKLRQSGFSEHLLSTFGDQDGSVYDHKNSFYSNHTTGQEPPLARRVRQVVDTLHGTLAGGRAGIHTVEEHGAKAVQWKEGLRDARRRERERELLEEQEAEAFGKEFAA
ncbi:uncharacterized protein JCM15063_000565 [Sporobolomyces koalae]|uniref:uncharacterized protein n=1 Tax=Sporobolomyces koalae TaxID=500713 RepID=UPI00317B8F99